MAPIVKDVENPAATTAPAAPATKPAQDASATRPQPVALEIPVTVNGARTVEGSEKREPFSESTKTVLVFGHGAVIRLASLVAPGQLLFVTNEKTKKEVVCQVVKSKNYRTVTGYVELEFTEPAAGFWGMRFPSERVTPAPVTPVAPALAPHPATPASPAGAVPPKVVSIPPDPAETKPAAPASVPVKPVATAPPVAPPMVAKPATPKPAQPTANHSTSIAPPQPTPALPIAPVVPAQTVAPMPPISIKPAPILVPAVPAVVPSAVSASASLEAKSATGQMTKTEATIPAVNPTTEELKQQAAHLQEQLSTLLFTQTSAAKQSAPEPVVTRKPEIIPTETAQKILQLAPPPDVKSPLPPVTVVQEIKPAPIAIKSVPLSMPVEEVKVPEWLTPTVRDTEVRPPEPVHIPAWLAPLARETDSKPNMTPVEDAAVSVAISPSVSNQSDAQFPDGESATSTVPPTMFGGELLGGSSTASEANASGGSKKGFLIGIAAAVILLIGGGAWYATRPGNAPSGRFASKPAATQTPQNSQGGTTSQPALHAETAVSAGAAASPLSQPTSAKPPATNPVPVASSPVNPTPPAVVKETSAAPRSTPPVEQPKKLGDVHFATPNLNHATNSTEGGDAAPPIDADQTSAGPPGGFAEAHSKEPAAPLPIGGDVKPAKLLKSVPPVYPPAARTQRVAGDVKIDALVDVAGNVSAMKVLSGPTLLHQAAMNALGQWKYEPAKLDGNPTPMHLTVTVQFRLQ